MNPKDLLRLYDHDMRIHLRLPELIYESAGRVLRDYSPNESSGYIDYADLDADSADAEIDSQIAFFRERGMPFTWKVFDHDQPGDLRARLAQRGFVIEDPDALLILDLQNAPASLWSQPLPAELEEIHDVDGIEGVVRLEEEIWQAPRDWLRKRLTHVMKTDPQRMNLYAVRKDGRTVSAAWTFYFPPGQFACLLGGATLPEYRRRGYYSSLLAARAREAQRRGWRFLTVDASPHSRPILEKHGFQWMGFSTLCRWTPETR